MKKKILVIQHHSKFGGASKSISEFILKLKNKFEFEILCPKGSTYKFFKEKKIKVYKTIGIPSYDITEIGSYSGFRKILLIREIVYLFFFLLKLKNLKKNYDLIHLNDTNLIIIAPLLKFFFNIKIICHVRTRVDKDKIPKLIKLISKKYIKKFICIDKSTFNTSPNKKKSLIIYNIFENPRAKKLIHLKKSNKLNIGFLGSLDFHKGLDFLFNCITDINKSKNNCYFHIGGSLSVKNNFFVKILDYFKIKRNFNKIYFEFRKKKFKNVIFLNEVKNLHQFYSKLDLICFPSRMNALGRPIIEASSYGIPSIVCLNKYYDDTIINKITGYVLKFGDKKNFINKLSYLSKNKKKIQELGFNAKKNYNRKHNSKKNLNNLYKLYNSL